MQPDAPPQPPAPQPPQGAGVPEYTFGSGAILAADGRMWPALMVGFGPATFQVIAPPEIWPAIKEAILSRMDDAMVEATKAGSGLTIARTMPPEPASGRSALVHP